jgi:uncharacterized protein (UPF0332 family)
VATWLEMSQDSLIAAQKLLREGHFRSSVSRAYYSAYYPVTHRLSRKRMQFPKGWKNPSHVQVIKLIKAHFRLPPNKERKALQAMRRLRQGREDADYPAISIDKSEGIQYLKEAALVIKTLEMSDEN